jgi:hypothetical protein
MQMTRSMSSILTEKDVKQNRTVQSSIKRDSIWLRRSKMEVPQIQIVVTDKRSGKRSVSAAPPAGGQDQQSRAAPRPAVAAAAAAAGSRQAAPTATHVSFPLDFFHFSPAPISPKTVVCLW